jgi:SM-20-related protein
MSDMRSNGEGNAEDAPAWSLMPPYRLFRDFLDEDIVSGLIDYALANQSRFTPTKVSLDGERAARPTVRCSLGLNDLGEFRPVFEDRVLGLTPTLIADLRVTPFSPKRLELELVAHGDGGFFKRHIDTSNNRKRIRLLSGVYYFNAEPKAFSGGAFRLHAIGPGPGERFVDIEPPRNSLLVFPSWVPHEVTPVACPSKRFADSRFSLNCWVLGRPAGPPGVLDPAPRLP